MMSDFKIEGFDVDLDRLPANFPTHRHEAEFWEALGRGVATFGFLEEVLGKQQPGEQRRLLNCVLSNSTRQNGEPQSDLPPTI